MRLRTVLPALLVLGAVAVAAGLWATRPQAAREVPAKVLPEVEVRIAEPGTHEVTVRAMGNVRPTREILLQPQVAGRVIERHPALIPGGMVEADATLLRIDARDYAAALASQQAALTRARLQVREEQTRQRVASSEWGDRAHQLDEPAKEIALRTAHVASAEADLASAAGQLARAKRDVARTIVAAPFPAIVVEASLEVGELVTPQTVVATLAAVDRYWVQVAVPVAHLALLEIPGVGGNAARGSTAGIVHAAGTGIRIERKGRIERLLGAVEQRGRMAQVLVAVDDPLGREAPEGRRGLPLLLGALVHVDLHARPIEGAVAIPRTSLSDGEHVWIVGEQDRLRRQAIDVVWRDRDHVIARGLAGGERIAVTVPAAATEGLEVAVRAPQPIPTTTP